jgi:hypothetical protein
VNKILKKKKKEKNILKGNIEKKTIKQKRKTYYINGKFDAAV